MASAAVAARSYAEPESPFGCSLIRLERPKMAVSGRSASGQKVEKADARPSPKAMSTFQSKKRDGAAEAVA